MSIAKREASYNIINYGAKPDGITDTAKPLLSAWAATCSSHQPASMYIPAGTFFVSTALFKGPCNNTNIRILISGTLIAPSSYSATIQWLTFKYVQGVSIFGGTIDGRGQAYWACKTANRNCPSGAASIAIHESKDVLVSGLKSLNSEQFHMVIYSSQGITVQGAKISAPANSPNTDGIHIQMSSDVTITGSTIKTGDDCVSMGEGATNVWIEHVNCGPGHGISIGSLGETPKEMGVQNITVKNVIFTGTQNGARIKTWGKPNTGFVKEVMFESLTMNNVQNPIVIDQNYCPGNVDCPNKSSGIKISQVMYNNVQGSSATPVAVKFDCSPSNYCSGIGLQDIKLTYMNKPAQAYCKNAEGSASGYIVPPSCL
ncbi:Polygalacturonase protein [Dioscorea alata]|uniref:Polygalacturonase protein n=1 Tax=Dioscorea alata TaxID=55571 RepID=A0ACB7VAQ0_DIOAL|nr:Polygalacturonase protein [Dioscorea alata]